MESDMAYNISYDHIPAGAARAFAALEDAVEFIGKEQFLVVAERIASFDNEDTAILALSFVGVQGYPARVMVQFCRAFNAQG
jgi:hypothetical protein